MLSAPIVVTAATDEPISLEDAKVFLRVDGDDRDVEIKMMVAAARGELEKVTGQRLVTQTVTVLADRFEDLEHLNVGPVESVVSIDFEDTAGAQQTLDEDLYELVGAPLEQGIRAVVGVAFPQARAASSAIAATLIVGYGAPAACPPELQLLLFRQLRASWAGTSLELGDLVVNDRIGG